MDDSKGRHPWWLNFNSVSPTLGILTGVCALSACKTRKARLQPFSQSESFSNHHQHAYPPICIGIHTKMIVSITHILHLSIIFIHMVLTHKKCFLILYASCLFTRFASLWTCILSIWYLKWCLPASVSVFNEIFLHLTILHLCLNSFPQIRTSKPHIYKDSFPDSSSLSTDGCWKTERSTDAHPCDCVFLRFSLHQHERGFISEKHCRMCTCLPHSNSVAQNIWLFF